MMASDIVGIKSKQKLLTKTKIKKKIVYLHRPMIYSNLYYMFS
jgi:hypothetical protein